MLKKTVIIVAMLILVKLWDGCRCPEPNTYKWNSLSTELLKNDTITSIDSIPFQDYGIRVAVEPLQIAIYQSGLTDAAFARKCVSYKMESNVRQIDIQTVSNFDSIHPAGSDITSYCKAILAINPSFTPIPVEGMRDYFHPTEEDEFNIFFTQNPSASGNYRFVVNVRLENGTVLTDTTQSVKLY